MNPSPSSEGPSATQTVFADFAVPNVTVTIDGTAYYPPVERYGAVEIILSDTTTVTLTNKSLEKETTRSTYEHLIKRDYKAASGSAYTIKIPKSLGVLLRSFPCVQDVYMYPTWQGQLELKKTLNEYRIMGDILSNTGSQARQASFRGLMR